MTNDYNYIDLSNTKDPTGGFLGKVEVPRSKSREEAWAFLEQRIDEMPQGIVSSIWPRRIFFAAAASIILLAGIFSMLRFYTSSEICPAGEHLTFILPDGSKVELNADSKLSYHPLWWRFDRSLTFEGEGYFEVEKGKKFSVISTAGTTTVLGTSFNIYSRDNEYKVTCLTGKVRVTSFAAAETVLSPEYSASINSQGEIIISKEDKAIDSHAWTNNMFRFASRQLALVFDEIGRQYDVKITLKVPVDYFYSGYFTKNRPVEETLSLVCTPFGLTFARISEKEYVISQN